MPRSSYYRWKQKYEKAGQAGLYRARPIAYCHPRRTSLEVVEKILKLRGSINLERYHGIKISESTVSRILKSHGVERLPKTAPRRALHTKRYAKTVPGHHIQVDVKFLQLKNREGKTLKRLGLSYVGLGSTMKNSLLDYLPIGWRILRLPALRRKA